MHFSTATVVSKRGFSAKGPVWTFFSLRTRTRYAFVLMREGLDAVRHMVRALLDEAEQVLQTTRRLAEREQALDALQRTRDQLIRREQTLEGDIAGGKRIVESHRQTLVGNLADGSFAAHSECFADLDRLLSR